MSATSPSELVLFSVSLNKTANNLICCDLLEAKKVICRFQGSLNVACTRRRKGFHPDPHTKRFSRHSERRLIRCDARAFSSSSFIRRKNLDVSSVTMSFDIVITTAFQHEGQAKFLFLLTIYPVFSSSIAEF